MKRLFTALVALLVLALPGLVEAQCTGNQVCVGAADVYDPTADEIAAQVYLRDKHNSGVCANAGLPSNCNQAAYDTACAAIPGCDASAIVYLGTGAGVRTFFLDYIKADIAQAVVSYGSEYRSRAKTAWNESNATQKANACLAMGKAADCSDP